LNECSFGPFYFTRVLGGVLATGRRWTAIVDRERLAAQISP
jgi:hypothetical protein